MRIQRTCERVRACTVCRSNLYKYTYVGQYIEAGTKECVCVILDRFRFTNSNNNSSNEIMTRKSSAFRRRFRGQRNNKQNSLLNNLMIIDYDWLCDRSPSIWLILYAVIARSVRFSRAPPLLLSICVSYFLPPTCLIIVFSFWFRLFRFSVVLYFYTLAYAAPNEFRF